MAGTTLLCLAAAPALAQQSPPQQRFDPEVRVDAILAGTDAVHGGVGITVPLGNYVRSGVVVAGGWSRDGASGRVDLFSRFHLDPFREHRWAPYGGGGISGRFDDARRTRVYLLAFVGLDGPVFGGAVPAVEAGFGGGARIGVILRRAAPNRR